MTLSNKSSVNYKNQPNSLAYMWKLSDVNRLTHHIEYIEVIPLKAQTTTSTVRPSYLWSTSHACTLRRPALAPVNHVHQYVQTDAAHWSQLTVINSLSHRVTGGALSGRIVICLVIIKRCLALVRHEGFHCPGQHRVTLEIVDHLNDCHVNKLIEFIQFFPIMHFVVILAWNSWVRSWSSSGCGCPLDDSASGASLLPDSGTTPPKTSWLVAKQSRHTRLTIILIDKQVLIDLT